MTYPGRIVEANDADAPLVASIAARLVQRGYAPTNTPGVSPADALTAAIKFFQNTHVDASGRPLKADGKVGPNTWAALFGPETGALALQALAVAQTQVDVMERPPGSNAGPEVSAYLASVGLGPGAAWCMAFVHWCFDRVASPTGNPMPRSGGVLDVWRRVSAAHPARVISKASVVANPALVVPGLVFVHDHGHGLGHTGFVKAIAAGGLTTIEGNTNKGLSREGVGVFELTRRSITDDELLGFLNFS